MPPTPQTRRTPPRPEIVDRLPPHDVSAEQGVLGCLLERPTLIPDAICKFRTGAEVFYDLRHQTIYNTILELYDDNSAVDVITLQERLNTWGKLEEVGGISYIMSLQDAVPSPENFPSYARIVLTKFTLRKIITECTETVASAYEANGHSDHFLSEFESRALNIRGTTEAVGQYVNIIQTTQELTQQYEAAHNGTAETGILTGFTDLDRICGGMMPQDLIIIAGLPSAGKTTIAINIAFNVAARGTPVGILSLETSGKKLIHRLTCYTGHIEGSKLLRGTADEGDISRLSTAFSRIMGMDDRIIICDSGGVTVDEARGMCRRMHQRGARLFVIDYLQLLECNARTEFDKVAKVSRAMKALSKELNCPIIVISALNREPVKGNKPRKPKLSDLRMSGQIEYDADKAWLLYDPDLRDEFNPDDDFREVVCAVAKHKDGPIGKLRLMFFPKQFRMESMTADDEPQPTQSTPNPEPPPQQSLPYAD